MAKKFDIVLFGATGFTGELVSKYFRDNPVPKMRIALAGRNLSKLENVRKRFGEPEWDLVEADSNDQSSLDAMARDAKVICTTVGPYSQYGAGVVEACVKEHAHYCDLTGETPFIRNMIDAHHDDAVKNDVRIVNCCGFDSVPSDLGTWMLQQFAIEQFGEPCDVVNMYVVRAKGGFSGGTVATLTHLVKEASKDKELRKLLLDPFSLNPKENRPKIKQRDQMGAKYADDIDRWTGPFLMAPINTRIVRRTNALLGNRYGENFRYSETMTTGKGLKGRVAANAIAAGSSAMIGALGIPPLRAVLQKTVLPDPGEGPSEEAQENGHFNIRFYGHRNGSPVCTATVKGFKDPGYAGTAIMLAESAKCLAFDDLGESGVVTPASAMPEPLLVRLRGAGMVFETELI